MPEGDYERETKPIGSGSFGLVYKGKRMSPEDQAGEIVVIKEMRFPEDFYDPGSDRKTAEAEVQVIFMGLVDNRYLVRH